MSSSNYKIRLPSTVLKYRNVPSNLLFAKILDRKNNNYRRRIAKLFDEELFMTQ